MNNFTEEHSKRLPTVRIRKVVLDNYKSVKHGEILFNCGKTFVKEGTQSDILGLYGQNGSGKTALIEALSILHKVMSGTHVSEKYAECIDVEVGVSTFTYELELQYPNGNIREVEYSFSIKKENTTAEDRNALIHEIESEVEGHGGIADIVARQIREEKTKVIVFDEKFSMKWENSLKKQLLIDTSSSEVPFIPDTKRKMLVGNSLEVLVNLEVEKRLARDLSRSFVFSTKLNSIIKDNSKDNGLVYEVLSELAYFAFFYLIVVDSKTSTMSASENYLPIYVHHMEAMIPLFKEQVVPLEWYKDISRIIENTSMVLGTIVPGIELEYKLIEKTFDDKGKPAIRTMLICTREGKEIPLKYESYGVKKIIQLINLIIRVYNQKSTTIAIDEFDAGIFEYLLGEILQIIQNSGKGQLIFTSHNLRPLEVLDKKFICFTTTNPENRYARIKGVGQTNNLRDMYYREFVVNEQEECLYNRTKQVKIKSALKMAWENINGEEA